MLCHKIQSTSRKSDAVWLRLNRRRNHYRLSVTQHNSVDANHGVSHHAGRRLGRAVIKQYGPLKIPITAVRAD